MLEILLIVSVLLSFILITGLIILPVDTFLYLSNKSQSSLLNDICSYIERRIRKH